MDDWWYEGMLRLLGGRVEAADALGEATGELRVELESVGYLEPGWLSSSPTEEDRAELRAAIARDLAAVSEAGRKLGGRTVVRRVDELDALGRSVLAVIDLPNDQGLSPTERQRLREVTEGLRHAAASAAGRRRFARAAVVAGILLAAALGCFFVFVR